MPCLDNIVALGICDTEAAPTSGFYLMQAGGMAVKNFANIATDSSGLDMVNEKKQLAITMVKNDFLTQISGSNVLPEITNPVYEASLFNAGSTIAPSTDYRGLVLYKNKSFKGALRETKITGVEIFPLQSGSGTIKIIDGHTIYTWPVEFDGGISNYFDSTQLDGFPYIVQSNYAQILLLTDVTLASAFIQCKEGCHGSPNPCGHLKGWDGTKYIKSEGYGLNITFQCSCNYENVLCNTPSIIGELIWIKWQMLIFDEHYKSNRFNGYVTYNKEMINETVMPQLAADYATKWRAFTNTLPNLLKSYRDDCLVCRGARWLTNI